MARLGKEVLQAGFVNTSLDKLITTAETRNRMVDLWHTVDLLLTQYGQPTKHIYRTTPPVPLGYNNSQHGELVLIGRYLNGETLEDPKSLAEFSVEGTLRIPGYDPETYELFSLERSFEAEELGFDFETGTTGQYLESEPLQKGERIVGILSRYFIKTPSAQLYLPD